MLRRVGAGARFVAGEVERVEAGDGIGEVEGREDTADVRRHGTTLKIGIKGKPVARELDGVIAARTPDTIAHSKGMDPRLTNIHLVFFVVVSKRGVFGAAAATGLGFTHIPNSRQRPPDHS